MNSVSSQYENMRNILVDLIKEEQDLSKNIKDEKEIESKALNMMRKEMKSKEANYNKKVGKLKETYDVEMMHADVLESLESSLNEDHAQLENESQATIKQIKHNVVKKNKEVKQMKDEIKEEKERNNNLRKTQCKQEERFYLACAKRDKLS